MPKICEGIYFIPGQDEMIPDSHVYIIGKPETGDLSMIDAGLMGKSEYKINAIKEMGLKPEDIQRVIMTHTHLDHVGCLPTLRKQLAAIEVWMHVSEAIPIENGDDRTVYGMDMFKEMCLAQYEIEDNMFKFEVHKKLKGREKLTLGGMNWEIIHIPGHSAGCIALYEKTARVLISGDVVYSDYAIGRFDLHGANPAELRESLYHLGELEVDILLPGHNRIMEQVPKGYIKQTADSWANYLV